jgi:hypothetical protein
MKKEGRNTLENQREVSNSVQGKIDKAENVLADLQPKDLNEAKMLEQMRDLLHRTRKAGIIRTSSSKE